MPIVSKSSSSLPPVSKAMAQTMASRWTPVKQNQEIYNTASSREEPHLRQADTIMFDPYQMIGHGSTVGMYGADPSAQRSQTQQHMPKIYMAMAVAGLLIYLNYLRSRSN